ncbi:MAG: hypothetical protein HOZ81_49690 [Streptomyces sp.]|nr:hypothetical protein [Streptomyces sp.]
MTEDDSSTAPAAAANYAVDAVRLTGTLTIAAGVGLALYQFIENPKNPALLWVAFAFVLILAGVGLRIEAAIRERHIA